MASAISPAVMAQIKKALQIPFDTFVQRPVSFVVKSEAFGVFKENRDSTPTDVISYMLENKDKTGQPILTRQGGVDIPTVKFICNPVELVKVGLMDTLGGEPAFQGERDDIICDNQRYQIKQVTRVGWLDFDYQMVQCICTKYQNETAN